MGLSALAPEAMRVTVPHRVRVLWSSIAGHWCPLCITAALLQLLAEGEAVPGPAEWHALLKLVVFPQASCEDGESLSPLTGTSSEDRRLG